MMEEVLYRPLFRDIFSIRNSLLLRKINEYKGIQSIKNQESDPNYKKMTNPTGQTKSPRL